ncbi:uncharacterized protein LOC120354321 [Nilaparvata lugens]|uniref:uncharacterized protein LOC120354321 n=1 Tax=Nilaparvata lugens TaxID=108931 RepID=UPI00193E3AD7|nr:uncharacterized protein LOC120354321 [Nilaparvata lugens]
MQKNLNSSHHQLEIITVKSKMLNSNSPAATNTSTDGGSSIAYQIYIDAIEMKPLVMGNIKELEYERPYNLLCVKRCQSEKHPDYGVRIIAHVERENDILSIYLPKIYITTMFKSITSSETVDMTGYSIKVSPEGRTHRVKLLKNEELDNKAESTIKKR